MKGEHERTRTRTEVLDAIESIMNEYGLSRHWLQYDDSPGDTLLALPCSAYFAICELYDELKNLPINLEEA